MKSKIFFMLSVVVFSGAANAATTTFFDSSQVATNVASGATYDTVSSNGYLFTYTRDKLFTGGLGMITPIGRPVAVAWPNGVEAQAVTVGPIGPAQITIKRVDGNVFDIAAFTAKLLANTAATGASFEVMPLLNGNDGFANPLAFDATGYYNNTFSYNMPSTALLSGFDTYTFNLFTDFAFTGLTLVDASSPVPIPTAFWLLGSGLVGLVGVVARIRKTV
jgi:hypothetical protein